MAELFNVDLPPRFQYKPGSGEEMKRDVEDYLERLSSAVDEMFKRVFDRLDIHIDKVDVDAKARTEGIWEVDGSETQLKTADEIDMQTKKIINVVDPEANQEAATKKFHDDNTLWELDGGDTEMKAVDDMDMQNMQIKGMALENRTDDTGCTQTGRIWFRTDV